MKANAPSNIQFCCELAEREGKNTHEHFGLGTLFAAVGAAGASAAMHPCASPTPVMATFISGADSK